MKYWFDRFIPIIFLILSVLFFREYFLTKKVPLPFNLLVSFYSPWKYETALGYGLSIPNKPLGNDNLKLFYPFRKFTTEELKAGRLPLWNPYFFSGSVHHGTYQSAIFYPLSVIYFLLPLVDAWSFMIIAQPVLSGWFMYLFLRSLDLSRKGSFFGALGFAFSGWMLAHWQEVLVIDHSILWLPLALYASNVFWNTPHRVKGILLFIISLVFSILGGFPQLIIYVFGTVFVWNVYRWKSGDIHNRTKYICTIVGSMLLSVVLTAFQWLPVFEAYLLAPRARVDSSYLFQKFLSPLTHLVTFLAPDFWGNPGTYNYFLQTTYLQERTIFVGLAILVFSLFLFFRKTTGVVSFWKYFTIITLSLGFALPTSWIFHILRVPVLSVAMPVRIFILAVFGLCILASFGIEQFFKEKSWKSIRLPITVIGLSMAFLWLFVLSTHLFWRHYPSFQSSCMLHKSSTFCSFILNEEFQKQVTAYATISFRNLILPSGIFVLLILSFYFLRKRQILFYIAMYAITLAGSFYLANKLLYFSDRQFEYPLVASIAKLKELAGYDRVWSYGDGYVVRNILSYYKIYSPEGYEALYPHRYGMLLNTIQTKGVVTDQIQRNDATLSESGQNEPMTHNPFRLRLMSLLGVKYVLALKPPITDKMTEEERFPDSLFTPVWEDKNWRIWEYRQALSRAYFVSDYIVEQNDQKIVDHLLEPSFDLRKRIVLEESVQEFGNSNNQEITNVSSDAKIVRYEPQQVKILVDAKQDGLLFLSDNYYPGWHAFVDGKEAKIYRANYSFRAVPVRKGIHQIQFEYDPISFKIGCIISSVALGCLLSILVIWKLRVFYNRKKR